RRRAARAARHWCGPSDVTCFTLDDAALHGQLVDRAGQRLTGDGLAGIGQLEQHPARLDVGDPPLRRTLARAHAGLGRLLGDGPVRVNVDPHLAATPDVPVDGDTGGFDLPVGQVGRLQRLDAVL